MTVVLSGTTYRRLCRARDYAAAHFAQPLTLDAMAREANLSPFHFHRLFAAAFGETPHGFLSALRISRAKRLLAAGEVSVTEACLEAGYSSLGTFSSRFRAFTGYSPREYQREARRVFGSAALWRAVYIPTCFLARFHPAT